MPSVAFEHLESAVIITLSDLSIVDISPDYGRDEHMVVRAIIHNLREMLRRYAVERYDEKEVNNAHFEVQNEKC